MKSRIFLKICALVVVAFSSFQAQARFEALKRLEKNFTQSSVDQHIMVCLGGAFSGMFLAELFKTLNFAPKRDAKTKDDGSLKNIKENDVKLNWRIQDLDTKMKELTSFDQKTIEKLSADLSRYNALVCDSNQDAIKKELTDLKEQLNKTIDQLIKHQVRPEPANWALGAIWGIASAYSLYLCKMLLKK